MNSETEKLTHAVPKAEKRNSENENAGNKQKVKKNGGKHMITQLTQSAGGLYVEGEFLNQGITYLVDTGACLTLASKELFEKIPHDLRPTLTPCDINLTTADKTPIRTLGKCILDPKIFSFPTPIEMVVANIESDAILGMDFLLKYGCDIYPKSGCLICQDEQIVCSRKRQQIKCCRITAAENLTIPAGHQVVVKGHIQMPKGGICTKWSIVEPTSSGMKKHDSLIVGRSLVDTEIGSCPVRVVNTGTSEIIHKGTTLGVLYPVDDVSMIVEDESKLHSPVQPTVKINQVNEDSSSKTPSFPDPTRLPEHIQDLYKRSVVHLDSTDATKVYKLLENFQDVFSKHDFDLGLAKGIKHSIDTGDAPPLRQPPRRLPMMQQEQADEEIDKMLKAGVIEPSTSSWSSPITLVKKKDGSVRFCIDYRRLNQITVTDAYALPRISECLDSLKGAKWFSTLDLSRSYWQVEMDAAASLKSAFAVRRGLYQFKVLPFGLSNSPATFERLMEHVLAGLQWEILLIYLDDVIVHGQTIDDELENLEKVFLRFRKSNLKLKPKKCFLFQRTVKYLGHQVSEDGIATDEEKVQSIKNWPRPTSPTDVRSFVGLCSYYRKFVKDFATIARPLYKLTEMNNKEFKWTKECEESFQYLKERLCSSPILAYPDKVGKMILDTDASAFGIGAVLSQIQDGEEKVIAYASRTLSKTERQYCVTRRELLAVVVFTKHFKHYLMGRRFRVRTDHSSLQWLMNFKEPEGQLARWLESLSHYNFDIEHRAGKSHQNADSLSRIPCKQCDKMGYQEQVPNCNMIQAQETENKVETKDQDTQVEMETQDGSTQTDPVEPTYKWIPKCWYKAPKNFRRRRKQPNQTLREGVNLITETNKWEPQELRKAQMNDPNFGWIIESLEKNEQRPPWKEISHKSAASKHYWSMWKRLQMKDGNLHRVWESNDGKSNRLQLILPKSYRKEIFEECHTAKTAGHFGEKKTKHQVIERFHWYASGADIELWLKQCDGCAAGKSQKRRRAKLRQYTVGVPMERIATDILKVPMSNSGFEYILLVGDYFTRFIEAYPIRNQNSKTVAKKIVEEFLCRYGVAREVHSDQGGTYESQLFYQVCKMLEMQKTRTCGFNPKSDGMIERMNRTLKERLTLMTNDNPRTWDQQLPYAMMAYRNSVHEVTGQTPNMMMFGRETDLPLDVMTGRPLKMKPMNEVDFVEELRERLEVAHEKARKHQKNEQRRQKRNYDKRANGNSFKEGDPVWLYNGDKMKGVQYKLSCKWEGPFEITKKIDDVIYRIQKNAKSKPKVVHFDRLKPYLGTEFTPLRNSNSPSVAEQNIVGDNEVVTEDHEVITEDHESVTEDNEVETEDPNSNTAIDHDMTETENETEITTATRIRRPPQKFLLRDWVYNILPMFNVPHTSPIVEV